MKRIALVGLYSIPNMGDRILCETSRYLLEQSSSGIEIIEVDVCPRYKQDYSGLDYLKYRVSRKLKTVAEKRFEYTNSSSFRYHYEYFMWWLRLNRYYRKILKNVDAIMFAGGGFLKFRTQGLNYYVEQIIKIAQKHRIPVMMNSVGIEGYSETDIRCQKLKRIINSECVKIITTRDDAKTLRGNYIVNPAVETARVGDPALWTPECYGVSKGEPTVELGINVIRGKVFTDYGNTCSYEELKEFYQRLIKAATQRNISWRLFSNGMKGDQAFGREILYEMHLPVAGNLLPAPKSSEGLLAMICSFGGIFGARLHACITAYSLDVPVVAFIWNEKIRMFADIIGKPGSFFEEREMDVEKVLDRFVTETAQHIPYEVKIREQLKMLTKSYVEKFLFQVTTNVR
ncbi:MAG: polysaccharide pyruvyl transferase family protein [Coriobacteriia bacterium]|nr:polysaccharide pyruvyl transferase family protein [Coriobacteriia bacterium]